MNKLLKCSQFVHKVATPKAKHKVIINMPIQYVGSKTFSVKENAIAKAVVFSFADEGAF